MKKLLANLFILTLGISATLGVVSCKSSGGSDDGTSDKGKEPRDIKKDQSTLEGIAKALDKGILVSEGPNALSVRNKFSDGVNFITKYVKGLNKFAVTEIVDSSLSTKTLLKGDKNEIEVKLTLGSATKNVKVRLINVLSELFMLVQDLKAKWTDWVIDLSKNNVIDTYNRVKDVEDVIKKEIAKHEAKLKVEIIPGETSKVRLKHENNQVAINFFMEGDIDNEKIKAEVKVTNVIKSELEQVYDKIKDISSVESKVLRDRHKFSFIKKFINQKVEQASIAGVKMTKIVKINDHEINSGIEKDEIKTTLLKVNANNDVVITLEQEKNDEVRKQDFTIKLSDVGELTSNDFNDDFENIIKEKKLVFELKIGDFILELINKVKSDIRTHFNFNVEDIEWDVSVASGQFPETEVGSLSDLEIGINIISRIGGKNLQRPIQIKYKVVAFG